MKRYAYNKHIFRQSRRVEGDLSDGPGENVLVASVGLKHPKEPVCTDIGTTEADVASRWVHPLLDGFAGA